MSDPVFEAFTAALRQAGIDETADLLIACSGGGDSTALLYLAAAAHPAARLRVATINHNLRPEAQEEVAAVTAHCARLGVSHRVFDWHWSGRGNLQAKARQARRDLLLAHAREVGADWVLMGHTRDDQAETVLMRLARGSGTDGLAGIAQQEPPILRPLLMLGRSDLRDWLRARNITWREDPSNADLRFDRVKAREMAGNLAALGLTQDRLIGTADVMRQDAELLAYTTERWLSRHMRQEIGDLCLARAPFEAAPNALAARALSAALTWFSGVPYKPRRRAMAAWKQRIFEGRPTPLGGVLACLEQDVIRLYREPGKTAVPQTIDGPAPWIWDNRWQINGPAKDNVQIAALGDALDTLPDWRSCGLKRASLETTPGLFEDGRLIAAPALQENTPWTAVLTPVLPRRGTRLSH